MKKSRLKRWALAFSQRAMSLFSILFWVLFIFSFDAPLFAGLSIISGIIHEMGHQLFVIFRGGEWAMARGRVMGFSLQERGFYSYSDELMLYSAGMIANIAAALLALPFWFFLRSEYILLFIALNIATALSNSLPIEGYDGYGILRTLLERRGTEKHAECVLFAISLGAISFFSILSLYFIDRIDTGYWVFAVFILSLLGKLKKLLKS